MPFASYFNEDGSASVLGRITAIDGSGAETGVGGEGSFIQQEDVSTIAYKIFDLEAPTTVVFSGTLTVSSVIYDTVQGTTTDAVWDVDDVGYNFQHDLAETNFPDGGVIIRIEYTVTLSGGAVIPGIYEGPVCSKYGS